MNLTTNKVKSIQGKSKNIFKVFQKTLKDIDKVQTEINMARAKRLEDITKKQLEIKELELVESRNARFAEKLNEFIA